MSNLKDLFEYFNIDLTIENCTDELFERLNDELFKFSPFAFKRHCNSNIIYGLELILRSLVRENYINSYEVNGKTIKIFYND